MTVIEKRRTENGVYRIVAKPSGAKVIDFKEEGKKNYEVITGDLEGFEAKAELDMLTSGEYEVELFRHDPATKGEYCTTEEITVDSFEEAIDLCKEAYENDPLFAGGEVTNEYGELVGEIDIFGKEC